MAQHKHTQREKMSHCQEVEYSKEQIFATVRLKPTESVVNAEFFFSMRLSFLLFVCDLVSSIYLYI